MSPEFNSGQKVEKTEPTHTEQAMRAIGEYIKDAELSSVRFQAFADYVDNQCILSILQDSPEDKKLQFQMEYAMCNETIRQRRNRIIGYKKEYEDTEAFGTKLEEAIIKDMSKGVQVDSFDYFIKSSLENAKNWAIDRAANKKNQ